MKTNKFKMALGFAALLTAITVVQVLAGASFDYGELPGAPPVGAANWVAWNDQGEISDGFPIEILTEDNTNCELGENIGYSEYGDADANIEWWVQIENFFFSPRTAPFSDNIYFVFGGLGGTHSGTIWRYTIDEWIITESATEHLAENVTQESSVACPIIYDPADVAEGKEVYFFGQPDSTYHVYRSQNGSGADNGASNGQYFWIATVPTDEIGNGSYVDDTTEESWYLVIQADPTTNEIIGCHSEPADPTSVSISDFSAAYTTEKTAIELSWQTASEVDILGFNVLRSTSEVGARIQLNEDQVAVENPGQMDGSNYSFDDYDVTMGHTYYYWIELIKTDSSRESVGPEAAFAGFQLFLPFVH